MQSIPRRDDIFNNVVYQVYLVPPQSIEQFILGRGLKRYRPGEYLFTERPSLTRKELIDAFARLPSSFQVGMPTIFPSPIMYITQKENGIFKIVFKPNGYAAIHKLSEKFNLKMEGFKRQDQF